MKKELTFRLIKICDIIYISLISYITIYILAIFSNKLFGGKFDKEKEEKSIKEDKNRYYELILKGLLILIFTSVILYIYRNLFEIIPSPFDGLYGFEHKRVKEIEAIPIVLFFVFFTYQYDILDFLGRQINII